MRIHRLTSLILVITILALCSVCYAAKLSSLTVTPGALYVKTSGGTTKFSASAAGAGYFASTLAVVGATTATGLVNANGGLAIDTSAVTIGGADYVSVFQPTSTTGVGFLVNSDELTEGTALRVFVDTDIVTTGKAFEVFTGATYAGGTSKFSVDEDGDVLVAGTLGVTGAGTLASLVCTAAGTFGGGYGSTGATISTAGVGQFNGAVTTDGALTADNIVCTNAATFGGGYGSTGATISTAGVGQFNGALTVDGAGTITGAAALNGGISADTTAFTVADTTGVTKVQANPVILSHRHRVTAAEINAGHSILPAISGATYRMVACKAIAYGGAVGTTTTVDVLGTQSSSGVKLVAYAQASLTRSAVLDAGESGAAVLVDGASFVACDANTAITVGKTGGDVDTATGVDIIISYVIE